MKQALRFSLWFLLLLLGSQPLSARLKVAVVLSGGGAKGVAHISALKAIEEAGIPIDYVVGTSMGSLIGGLYSIGYTPHQLDSLVRSQDWNFLLSDKIRRKQLTLVDRDREAQYQLNVPLTKKFKESALGGVIKGQNLAETFSTLTIGYHGYLDFDSLPIPFACVATDVVSGEEVVFRSGELYTAMRASMSIPGVFAPVRQGNWVLVDGGLRNNFPTDVAKGMGADVVIGVSVQDTALRKADEIVAVTDVIQQMIDLATRRKFEDNLKKCDLVIRVPVRGYSASSFSPAAIDSLIHRGEVASVAKREDLLALRRKIYSNSDSLVLLKHGPFNVVTPDRKLPISRLSYQGISDRDWNLVRKKCHLRNNESTTLHDIETAITSFRAYSAYDAVNYTLVERPDSTYRLMFTARRQYERSVRAGAHFDTDEIAALQANGTYALNTRTQSNLEGTVRLGKRYWVRAAWNLEPTPMHRMSFAYDFRYQDLNIERNGSRLYSTTYSQHSLELLLADVCFRNQRYQLGARYEHFSVNNYLTKTYRDSTQEHSMNFVNYFARLIFDGTDQSYYPTRGAKFDGTFTVYTDNFVKYKKNAPFATVQAAYSVNFPLKPNLAMQLFAAGRGVIGKLPPFVYSNFIGSDYAGRFISQQLPFAGINTIEQVDRYIGYIGAKFRLRLFQKNYVSVTANYGMTGGRLHELYKERQLVGGSITYSYDSFVGPIEATLNYFNKAKKPEVFVNIGTKF